MRIFRIPLRKRYQEIRGEGMAAIDDQDSDVGAENPAEEDIAPSGGFGFVKRKKLTPEESASPAVVNALMERLCEYVKEVNILRKKENEYNNLKVTYARLDEKFKVYSKASVFWDIVLVLCPLAIGYILTLEFAKSANGIIIVVALLSLITAALVARYFGFSEKKK